MAVEDAKGINASSITDFLAKLSLSENAVEAKAYTHAPVAYVAKCTLSGSLLAKKKTLENKNINELRVEMAKEQGKPIHVDLTALQTY